MVNPLWSSVWIDILFFIAVAPPDSIELAQKCQRRVFANDVILVWTIHQLRPRRAESFANNLKINSRIAVNNIDSTK